MTVKRFARCNIKSGFSYKSPAKIDDLSVPVRNDLSYGTWDSVNDQKLNWHSRVWTAEGGCLGTLLSRVLVVDDYEPFRQFICSTLRARPELQIVGEVSDGLRAVRTAEELRPDLIVLDIGLPSLTGVEVARRIRKLSPESKILFVSQESSADVVQEALGTGARGYVVKIDAGSELLEAVNSVLRGEQFVGKRFSAHNFVGAHSGVSRDLQGKVTSEPFQKELEIAH